MKIQKYIKSLFYITTCDLTKPLDRSHCRKRGYYIFKNLSYCFYSILLKNKVNLNKERWFRPHTSYSGLFLWYNLGTREGEINGVPKWGRRTL